MTLLCIPVGTNTKWQKDPVSCFRQPKLSTATPPKLGLGLRTRAFNPSPWKGKDNVSVFNVPGSGGCVRLLLVHEGCLLTYVNFTENRVCKVCMCRTLLVGMV